MTSSQNKAAIQVHLPQWQASQLSQAAYCKRHNLKPHIFSYYKNKLSESRASTEQASSFIPVKLVADDSLAPSSIQPAVIVTHTNGFSLEIKADMSLAALKPVLELLRSIS